jgi:hypothetical protein
MPTIVQLPFDQNLSQPFPFSSEAKDYTIEVDWTVSCGLDGFFLRYIEVPTIKQVFSDLIDALYAGSIDRKFAFKHVCLHAFGGFSHFRLSKPAIDYCSAICIRREAECQHASFQMQRFGYSCKRCRAFYDYNKYELAEGKITPKVIEEKKAI